MTYNEMTGKGTWMTVMYDTVAEQGTCIYIKMTGQDIEVITKQGPWRYDTEEEQRTWITMMYNTMAEQGTWIEDKMIKNVMIKIVSTCEEILKLLKCF